ncbi:MAG: hypothetical protein H6524_09980 [Actinobacteria bacterium]|nr:hypothetical protein [Actinomycetota bacterium]MCO5300030.1 hypothetical protein [Candidatus Nanopelagicales bacterium]MCB9429127.1 hypothetical protein [Actinomycetota bacterium]HPE13186.1 hypothetical protein [Actinomycetota bacterium]HPJ20626.1 hypothetical protein [Actinomycetota bacterium]
MTTARRRLVAIATVAVLLPSLSGCWAGFDAQTSMQANQAVGNGANMSTGDIEIRGATWVRNTANPAEATLTATFVNNSDVPDKLVKVEIEPPSPMGITGGELEVPVIGSLRTGYWSPNFINAFGVQAFPSTFVTTTFTFENAGTVTGDVFTTPNTGQYAGVAVSLVEQKKLQELVEQTDTTDDTTTTEKVAKAKKKKKAQAAGE